MSISSFSSIPSFPSSPPLFPYFTSIGTFLYGIFLVPAYLDFSQSDVLILDSIFLTCSFIGTFLAGYLSYRKGRLFTIIICDFFLLTIIIGYLVFEYFIFLYILKMAKGLYIGVNFPLVLIILKETLERSEYEWGSRLFQLSNTVGILFCSLLLLEGNFELLQYFEAGILFIRIVYFAYYVFVKNYETKIFLLFNKIKADYECEEQINIQDESTEKREFQMKISCNIDKKEELAGIGLEEYDTFLRPNFLFNNLFKKEYIYTFIVCLLFMMMNQTIGINFILKYNNNNDSNIYLCIMNFVGALFLIIPLKIIPLSVFQSKNIFTSLTIFEWSYPLLIAINVIFIFFYDEVHLAFSLIFLFFYQFSVSFVVYDLLIILIPDIGIFVVISLHWTFSMLLTMIKLFFIEKSIFIFMGGTSFLGYILYLGTKERFKIEIKYIENHQV